jgi:hypothetical protein
MNTKAQREKILDYLVKGGRLTALKAQEKFGCMRLGARIFELKDRFNIRSQFISVKNRNGDAVKVKEYWMEVIEG